MLADGPYCIKIVQLSWQSQAQPPQFARAVPASSPQPASQNPNQFNRKASYSDYKTNLNLNLDPRVIMWHDDRLVKHLREYLEPALLSPYQTNLPPVTATRLSSPPGFPRGSSSLLNNNNSNSSRGVYFPSRKYWLKKPWLKLIFLPHVSQNLRF